MDWLKQALATVYSKDGLVGIVVVAAIIGAALWLFGSDILSLF